MLTFNQTDRATLAKMRATLAHRMTRQIRVESDFTDDGAEWAAFLLDDGTAGGEVLVSVQTTRQADARAFVIISERTHDLAPRTAPAEDLAGLAPQLVREALVHFRCNLKDGLLPRH